MESKNKNQRDEAKYGKDYPIKTKQENLQEYNEDFDNRRQTEKKRIIALDKVPRKLLNQKYHRPTIQIRSAKFYKRATKTIRILQKCFSWIILATFLITVGIIIIHHQQTQPYRQALKTQIAQLQSNHKIKPQVLQQNSYHQDRGYHSKAANYDVEIGDYGDIAVNHNNIYVSDNADIIPKSARKKIYDINQDLKQNANGAQLMVITLDSLSSDEKIDKFALKAFNTLGIGQRHLNNGVLYVIDVEDHQTRITVGTGLENILDNGTCQTIVDDKTVKKDYRGDDYSDGILRTVNMLTPLMHPSKTTLIHSDKKLLRHLWRFPIICFVVLIIVDLIIAFYINFELPYTKRYLDQMYAEMKQIVYNYPDNLLPYEVVLQIDLFMLTTSTFPWLLTSESLEQKINLRRFKFQFPDGKIKRKHFLYDDTLYDYDGAILTHHYSTSDYKNNSGGSFGGGSSSGGGATGSW
ncbi:TPM domain-containing protein [Bombilactobacillus thymidiniphilus]|uniref:TPM domain-containing protein n=1 Tax=Bombilactobacillus thymidiniphilus TaxID=2923363 RepID=A0ABY4PBL8_9LACO|nr:TPM domain-containing protein [Bombilactobacillus thymidiniphilus]UQS83149.1 TPM domain-containing protein [Bombilactobacillus thymidiniphilus]